MAITYGSAAGTIITSFAMNEAIPDQAQQTNSNTIVVSDLLSVIGNGNIGIGTLGTGDSYLDRRITVEIAGTPQERIVTSDIAGTGTTRILTVHEDWDTVPIATDTIHVYYELADVEEGGSGGGISFATRTGLWTLTRIITIGDGTNLAGLSMHGGAALEQADRGALDSFLVENNGYFRIGYYSAGSPISGGIFAITSASDDEPAQTFAVGSDTAILDSLVWAQVALLSQTSPQGAKVLYDNVKLLKSTLQLELIGDTIRNSVIAGTGTALETVIVSLTDIDGLVLTDIDSIRNNDANSNILKNLVFVNVPNYFIVFSGSTVNLIDTTWDLVDFNDLTFLGAAGSVNDNRSLSVLTQKADGTALQDSVVTLFEGLSGNSLYWLDFDNLVYQINTDVNGRLESSFTTKSHDSLSTLVYGAYSYQVGKWLYLPFVAAQQADKKLDSTVVLSIDPNIVEQVQSTALTAGSGIVFNEDANPSELISFNTGSGTLVNGMIITFSPSGAVGTITSAMSGDSIVGEVHFNDRNAIAITNGDTFSRTGGTAGTFSGTYVADSKQAFTKYILANNKSYQTVYDYFAAVTTEVRIGFLNNLEQIAQDILSWCRDQQTQALYNNGSSFKTERSYGKGVIIVNGGAGTIDYFTDDADIQWTPPTSITLSMTVKNSAGSPIPDVLAYIDDDNLVPYIMNTTTNASGLATVAHTDGVVAGARWRARKYGYKEYDQIINIGSTDKDVAVTLITDPQQT